MCPHSHNVTHSVRCSIIALGFTVLRNVMLSALALCRYLSVYNNYQVSIFTLFKYIMMLDHNDIIGYICLSMYIAYVIIIRMSAILIYNIIVVA